MTPASRHTLSARPALAGPRRVAGVDGQETAAADQAAVEGLSVADADSELVSELRTGAIVEVSVPTSAEAV